MAPSKSQRRKASQRPPLPGWSRWLLCAVLVVWAFVLGILVGQGVIASPEQIQWFMETTGLADLTAKEQIEQPLVSSRLDMTSFENLQNGKTAPPPAPSAQPDKSSADSGNGYYVQVASFKLKDQAQDLQKKLSAAGHPAQTVETKVGGLGTRHRVRVGPYISKSQALQAMETFRTRYNLVGLVIKSD